MLQKYKLIKCLYQRTNLGQLDCSSKLSLRKERFTVSNCEKNCFQIYIKNIKFTLKVKFHCESPYLNHVIIFNVFKEEYIGHTRIIKRKTAVTDNIYENQNTSNQKLKCT